MNDQERDFARKIVRQLDRGSSQLRPGVAYRLQLARQQALARRGAPKAARDVATVFLAGAGGTISGGPRPIIAQLKFWVGVGVLVAAIFGALQWEAYQQTKEIEDLDAQILSSDLPIDAYLDRGFQNWLKTVDFNR